MLLSQQRYLGRKFGAPSNNSSKSAALKRLKSMHQNHIRTKVNLNGQDLVKSKYARDTMGAITLGEPRNTKHCVIILDENIHQEGEHGAIRKNSTMRQ